MTKINILNKDCPAAITKFRWKVTTNCELNKIDVNSVPNYEQEAIINMDRLSDTISIHTSLQPVITKLKKNKWFKLTRVSFNPRSGKVIDVTGLLPQNFITIRNPIESDDLKDWRQDSGKEKE